MREKKEREKERDRKREGESGFSVKNAQIFIHK